MTDRSQQLLDALRTHFDDRLMSATLAYGEVTLEVAPADYPEVCQALRDDVRFGFEQLIDLCGVDYSQFGRDEWATSESSSTGFSRGVESGSSED